MRKFINARVALFLAASTMLSQAATADWAIPGPTNADPQNMVIIVSENPRSNAERTCLAVTLAKTLANNPLRPHNVTIFATLDGTALGLDSVVGSPRFKCTQSDGSQISLRDNLEQFLGDNDNHLVLCPICYAERFGDTEPDYGVRPGFEAPRSAVIDVLSNADKVIDF